MTEISDLRTLLQLKNMDDTKYTDAQLTLLISQAKSRIGDEFTQPHEREDYVRSWGGTVYMTDYYPIRKNGVIVLVNDEIIPTHKITEEGLIYFDNHVQGELTVTYVQEYSSDDISSVVLPLAVYMIEDLNTTRKSSITEGDVSITFKDNSILDEASQINNLIEKLRSKYKARVRLL